MLSDCGGGRGNPIGFNSIISAVLIFLGGFGLSIFLFLAECFWRTALGRQQRLDGMQKKLSKRRNSSQPTTGSSVDSWSDMGKKEKQERWIREAVNGMFTYS